MIARITWLALVLVVPANAADDKKPRYPNAPSSANVKLVPEAWKTVQVKEWSAGELDRVLSAQQKRDKVEQAPLISDEAFCRRVHLDLVGRPATTQELREFVSDPAPEKRSKLIDKLLESREYARHRARQWRDILVARATNNQGFVKNPRERALEEWLFQQFQENATWDRIARALITSESGLELREPTKGGDSGLLLCHQREDGPVERANDVARVFLGINLQCAQCHDHPDDIWKREDFHQMAAFFGRLGDRVRLIREPTINFQTNLISRPFGEYRMADTEEASRRTVVHPRFLTGERPGRGLSDQARRKALAGYVTAKDSYYFAAAFVNRTWGEMMGQAFVMPVDNLGPLQPALYSEVMIGLAASFRATGFDVKKLYRLIANSEAYQRQMRLGDSLADHVRFAGMYPTRLRGEALWDALNQAVGPISEFGGPGMRGRFGAGAGMGLGRRGAPMRIAFQELFKIDASANPEDVEGSVPQALMLMNNQAINAQIRATGNTVLARVLRSFPENGLAIEQLYLRALGRSPTEREKQICLAHLEEVGSRGAAFEDILWSLINSAEFRTKR